MFLRVLLLLGFLLAPALLAAAATGSRLPADVVQSAVDRLVERHGDAHSERIRQGVRQVAERWWSEDGSPEAFVAFCDEHFIADPAELQRTFERIQTVMEQVDGHLHEVRRELTSSIQLDTGPILRVDRLFSRLDLSTHVNEDLFDTKLAFLALLNFPVHTLSDRLEQGPQWDEGAWARSRMTERFAARVPSEVSLEISRAFTDADTYIDQYNIRMDRLITAEGKPLFPENLRLISHWGLRDELASHYNEPDGLEKQRMIRRVMERIVRQEIPRIVIDNPEFVWCPETNEVRPRDDDADAPPPDAAREPDTRYATLLGVFDAVRKADPYIPTAPDFVTRRFELGRQLSEKQVEDLLVSVLESEEVKDLANRIERRLGRPLEPFDIWYSGFKSRGAYGEEELDRIVGQKYPTREAFQSDLPRILRDLGFAEERARWLAERIEVDPSRGAGHALGAVRREDNAHLRTRIPVGGMKYKGYNIAIHELGHNVEQVFSLNGIDDWWLNGVPNNAFTEALAFVFQRRDLELLGLGADEARRNEALGTLWSTYEIGGVALVDMKVWRWMYDHPQATPAQLREATLAAAREVWNRYYAPVFDEKDIEILAVYSHMIAYALYLPDYPIGHIIAFQLEQKLRDGDFGAEFERVCRQGRITPDAWMRGAVGGPISAEALLAAARQVLEGFE